MKIQCTQPRIKEKELTVNLSTLKKGKVRFQQNTIFNLLLKKIIHIYLTAQVFTQQIYDTSLWMLL